MALRTEPSSAQRELLLILRRAWEHVAQQDMPAALAAFSQALALEPKRADIWQEVARVYGRMHDWNLCLSSADLALTLDSSLAGARHLRAMALFHLGKRAEALAEIDALCAGQSVELFWASRAYIHSHNGATSEHTLEVFQDWGRRFADPITRRAPRLPPRNRDPKRRLRLGYVTADFREHSIAFFMSPVLSHHDRSAFEVHVYSSSRRDGFTEALQSSVECWHEVAELDDESLAARVRADGIDILVDLSGHTEGHRLLAFARRPAPVQVTWLGFNLPLGMKAMDYRLIDDGFAPPGHEKFYSETLFRLACIASYVPPDYAPLCMEPPILKNGYPTLISLNSSAKITDDMLRVWARILHARTDARLIIMVKERDADAAQSNMQPRVEAAGMPADRVFVLQQQPLNQFMELGHIADVALDTSPISGGTTTVHALWMGLPIVALNAERGVDAATARTLEALGYGDWVAGSVDEYVEKALGLMDDEQGLVDIRHGARERLSTSAFMDYPVRTRELEKAFRLMWLNYLDGRPHWLDASVNLEQAISKCGQGGSNYP